MKPADIIVRIRPYALAIACLIVAAGSYLYATTRSSMITELEAEQDTLARQITLIDNNTRNSTGLAEEFARLEELLQRVDEKLFDSDARAINTNFFYQLERDSNIRIAQARQGNVQPARDNETFSRIDFTLVVEGTFEELVEFVYRLQTLDALIRPVNLSLQAGGGAGGRRAQTGDRQMTMSINLRVLAQ